MEDAFDPGLLGSNWELGKLPLSYDTNYKKSHPEKVREDTMKVRDREEQIKTSWKLGQHGNPYLSEFKEQ